MRRPYWEGLCKDFPIKSKKGFHGRKTAPNVERCIFPFVCALFLGYRAEKIGFLEIPCPKYPIPCSIPVISRPFP